MIRIKNAWAVAAMIEAGLRLQDLFKELPEYISVGISTEELDRYVGRELEKRSLKSMAYGYHGYTHMSCISVNTVVVHGVPSAHVVLQAGDTVSVDVCASYNGYCADMARTYVLPPVSPEVSRLISVTQGALDAGITYMRAGNRLGDVSAAIGDYITRHKCGIVRDYAGHGIGRDMHEDPEVPNYGKPHTGPVLRAGMALALEPMVTLGSGAVELDADGWTVRSADGSLSAHIEDTIIITDGDPRIITRSA